MVERIEVAGPYFEDLRVGQVFVDAPSVTLTSGHAMMHQAVFGDRLRLPLDVELSRTTTGRDAALANPSLVCNVAIGQTTLPSQRVLGNLFYRGLLLQRPVFIGDTLRTRTRVAALRQNRSRGGRASTGMAVFEMHVENQLGETVLDFYRCPMLPCRDPAAETGHADSFDAIPNEIDLQRVHDAVPVGWRLDLYRKSVPGPHFAEMEVGSVYEIEGRDTVTSAPEIARMTLNVARSHTDASASPYGRRLVYGGHTISTAAAQLTHALPSLVNLIAWRNCDHNAPVFEGDLLRSEVSIDGLHPNPVEGGLLDLRALVFAERGPESETPGEEVQVLDWQLIGLMA